MAWEPTCLDCRFYLEGEVVDDIGTVVGDGLCRRYPKSAENEEFPAMFKKDWCGEHDLNPDKLPKVEDV